jgi:orotate phosphoribosyltransferase-like protein
MGSQTPEQIAQWAEQKTAPADTPSYSRLTDADRVTILKLHDEGLTQVEIAQRLNRSQSTISDTLSTFADTTLTAKRYLAAKALRMAENIVEQGQPRDHVAALKGLRVLAEDNSQVKIAIGISLPGIGLSPQAGEVVGEGE